MIYEAGKYDAVVVGAGHAGCEAALAAARMGCQTLLATLSVEGIALMPCNPSIGGPAKAQLVREMDASWEATARALLDLDEFVLTALDRRTAATAFPSSPDAVSDRLLCLRSEVSGRCLLRCFGVLNAHGGPPTPANRPPRRMQVSSESSVQNPSRSEPLA